MKYLSGIMPFIVLSGYITAGNIGGFRLSLMRPLSVAGLALMILCLYLRRKVAGGLSVIDGSFFIYMVFNGAAFWVLPLNLTLLAADYPTGILYAILFFMIAGPALISKRYFTEFFARKNTPDAVRETDIYKSINCHMTWVWATIFALSAFITVIPSLLEIPGSLFTGLLFQVLLPTALVVGVGIPFNKWYPGYYQHKMGIELEMSADTGLIETSAADARQTNTQQKEEIMTDQLKVVVINGSPHSVIGNTGQMIQMIASSLAQEGIHVEEVLLADRRIDYCIGCAVCLEKGRCWRPDDYGMIADKLLTADGIILASPVYFGHVTAQMKAFIDRSLSYGHKPRRAWKPGLAVSVSAGRGETDTALYLAKSLHIYGAFSVGTLTAIATNLGAFLGKDNVETRAHDLARDLARAIKEKRQYPATDEGLNFYLFMKDLVLREKDFMRDDYRYWQETGLLEGFESYARQQFSSSNYDPEVRKEWLKEIIKEDQAKGREQRTQGEGEGSVKGVAKSQKIDLASVTSCRELLEIMPRGFKAEAAKGLIAVFQFEITGSEVFTVHLKIEDSICTLHEGPHEKPDVIIKSPAGVWLAISRGEINGQTAFMSGKYKAEGNIGLLLKMKSLFG